jgi:transcriptional regulator with XRE-family HTH domain
MKRGWGVSEQLRAAIVESGLSLQELGRSAGVAASVLSRFVRGERTLKLATVDRLCVALGYGLCPLPGRRRRGRN